MIFSICIDLLNDLKNFCDLLGNIWWIQNSGIVSNIFGQMKKWSFWRYFSEAWNLWGYAWKLWSNHKVFWNCVHENFCSFFLWNYFQDFQMTWNTLRDFICDKDCLVSSYKPSGKRKKSRSKMRWKEAVKKNLERLLVRRWENKV